MEEEEKEPQHQQEKTRRGLPPDFDNFILSQPSRFSHFEHHQRLNLNLLRPISLVPPHQFAIPWQLQMQQTFNRHVGMAGVGMAGVGTAGVGMAGVGMAGVGMAGVGMAGVRMAGVGMAGVGMAGVGMAGVGMADVGMADVGNGVGRQRPRLPLPQRF